MSKNSNIKNSLKIKNLKFKIGVLVVLVVFVVFPQKADASAFSVGVYPPITKINALPSVSLQTPIIIKNKTSQTETFDISFRPFTQSDEENGQIRYLRSDELDLKDPLIFQRFKIFDGQEEVSSVELAPQQEKKLSLHLDIPEEENISDYYFSVLFTSRIISNENQTNKSQILTSIATNILLSIGSREMPKAEIRDFSTPFFKEQGPVKFSVKASNPGEQYLSARGFILIRNLFGQTVGRVDLDSTNILAGTSRFIPAAWPETFLVGPYTATLNLTFSDRGPFLTQTIHFFGAPLRVASASLIVIFLIFLIRARVKKHLRQ